MLDTLKVNKCTLKKLDNLMKDNSKEIHGVYYTNSFFSQRYLCRTHMLVKGLDIKENEVKLTVTTRLERTGLLEIENTLDMLVSHEAGDLPGFSPEEPIIAENAEAIGVNKVLFSVDLFLILKNPEVTYQEFTIAGSKFTLLELTHRLEDDFEQSITVLFGDSDKLYFYSHFFDKVLDVRETKLVLDLIADKNITGKSITSVKLESDTASSGIFPYEELISCYKNANGDYIFGNSSGYIGVSNLKSFEYRLSCVPNTENGTYMLVLRGKKETIRIYTE